MTSSREALILGGGVAGYAAAISLAKAGRSVTLLDKDLTGPDRLGESLDWETARLLKKLDISPDDMVARDEATIKLGAVASHAMMDGRLRIGFHIIYRMLMKLVGRTQRSYHVDRGSLSRTLNSSAGELGVELIETRICRVETDGDRVVAVEGQNGERYLADHFLDSTGHARLLAKAVGVGVTKIGPKKLAVSARMEHQYDHLGTRIRLDDSRSQPSWLWDINIGEEITDVGAVFVAEDVADARRRGMTVSDLYRSELERHDDLAWAINQVPDAGVLDRCAFQDQVSDRMAGDNWALAGQSAAVIDPILSSGVSFALRSGISSAEVIDARCTDPERGEVLANRHTVLLRSHALTVNTLLEQLWYKSRLRFVHGFAINVLLLLVCNFNLNHLQARWFVQTRFGAPALVAFHRVVRRVVPGLARTIEAIPTFRRRNVRPASSALNIQSPNIQSPNIRSESL